MSDLERPNPDALLASIQREDSKSKRGRLKIFLGMAPGVGKTYAMLKDAQQRDSEGIDVVVGYVETHNRSETQALLEGLVIAPRRQIEYRGVTMEEMDLDGIIFLRPRLVLVDELAHTNVEGSRHPKRYQDVLELLDLGIDVSTTLNVQHIESRADAVRQITGAPIHETVPDSVLDLADEIQLIDLSPAQLRERLAEGKVYLGPRADAAAQNFFKEDNLTALREIALRLTAERVDQELRQIRRGRAGSQVWRSGERLMVAVGTSPFSLQLVRWTRRMAYAQNAPWVAVSVIAHRPLSTEMQRQLDKNLSTARELGAEVILTHDENVADALIRVARQNNVTQIVTGKPLTSRLLEWLQGGSLVDQLIARSGEIHIYVVPAEQSKGKTSGPSWRLTSRSRLQEYLTAAGSVAAVTAASWFAVNLTGYWSIALFYLLGVILLGLFLGRGPVLLAATLCALTWDYLFIPPIFTFYIGKFEDALMFGIFFVVALVTGQLTSRIRVQERDERRREQRAQALYRLTRSIASASTTDELLANAVTQIRETIGADVAFVLAKSQFGLAPQVHHASTFLLDEKELGVATWAYRNRHNAGRFTDTLPSAQAFHLPLATTDQVVGVMVVRPLNDEVLTLDQRDLLESFARQLAVVLEKEKLRTESASAQVLAKSDQLHRTLLNSISHELRTPLAVIQTATEEMTAGASTEKHKSLIREMNEALDRLKRLVKNLLDSARLESVQFEPKREWGEVRDLVHEAVELARPALKEDQLYLNLPDQPPLIHGDFGLLSQAVANLLHNAAVHTPSGTRITLTVEASDKTLILRVTDEGEGIPLSLLPHLFEKFSRASDARPGGTGLGLSIARGFVEAHGGTLEAYNQPSGHGAIFVIRLPLEKPHDTDELKS
jgi:two-component system sensor histidine kinase KdpD